MDREVCGVCGAWKGDDELIALRQDLAAARALLYRAYPYVEDAQYDSDEMRLAKRTLLYDIDAALAGMTGRR